MIAVLVVAFATSRTTKSSASRAHEAVASKDTTTTSGGSSGTTSDGGPASGGERGSTAGGSGAAANPAAAPLDLKAQVKDTSGLHSGDAVTVHIDADKGSFIYGVEMRMCSAGTAVHNDFDMIPSTNGRCIGAPLAPGTDGFKIVPSDGDRTSMTTTYTVGTGSETNQLDAGGSATVTCDHDHPCELVVKYQVPNGFGYRTYPLTFA